MLTWIVAAAAGVAAAALLYGLSGRATGGSLIPLALLRAGALTLLFALLFDAAIGAPRTQPPLVALDASASWWRAAPPDAWIAARAHARSLGDELLLFGDSVRPANVDEDPRDAASRVQGVVERAVAAGRPLVVVTDGEIDDPEALERAPAGSRIELRSPDRGVDAAVTAVDAPRFAVAGDSIDVRVGIRAGDAAVTAATLSLLLEDAPLARLPIEALDPMRERTEVVRLRLPAREGPLRLRVAISANGDAEPRNDTAAVAIDLTRAAGAVLVSTAPDFDSRYMIPVLRGAVSIPTEAFFQVSPGNWRREGSLAPVAAGEVRAALARSPLAILHGDTAHFGAPRSIAGGSLALVPTSAPEEGEWFAVAAPPSPLASALSGVPWDSLPPLLVGAPAPALGWEGLVAARARRFDRRMVVSGTERGRRVVVVSASGFWRWRFRGGVAADAHAAFWGGIFDWLSAERPDPRGAIPASGVVRAGEPVRWRRGAGGADRDTILFARVQLRGASPVADSIELRFTGGALEAETQPLAQGVYDVQLAGGRSVLEISASRELLPRASTVAAGSVPGVPVAGERPRLRDEGWAYLLLLAALCGEWLLRRRRGLR